MASEPNTWPPASAHRKMTPASIQTLYAVVWQRDLTTSGRSLSIACSRTSWQPSFRASVDRETYPHLKHSVATVKFAEVAK